MFRPTEHLNHGVRSRDLVAEERIDSNGQRDPVSRAIRILEYMALSTAVDLGIREMGTALAMPPSSVHRALRALQREGFVAADTATKRYRLGKPFLSMAQQVNDRHPVWKLALSEIRALVDELNETSLLGLYEPERLEMMFAYTVESTHPVRYVAPLDGQWMAIHAGASGLGILAFLTDEEIERVIRVRGLSALTADTITDPDKLRHEIAIIRERGYALSIGQRIRDAVGIAVPILASSQVAGDVIVTFPVSRYEEMSTPQIVDIVHRIKACARNIGDLWGTPRTTSHEKADR
jgi:IclR family transcriptional regulator, acetate operon repressor